LVERTLSLKGEQVINKGMTKYILRQSMKGVLPERIRMRMDKIGFETPEDDWFRTKKFKDFVFDLLDSKTFKERGYINPDKAMTLYKKHLNKEINISKEVWKWINLELWFQMFID
jgi:asparagine synthase (glutamine-hydrolysing)